MKKILSLNEWEREKFYRPFIPKAPDVRAEFPSRYIYFSSNILKIMRLSPETCPGTVDQWFELCHPENHNVITRLERLILGMGSEKNFSVTRKLYCGDGVYRSFRLDANIKRDSNGNISELSGNETPSLSAWLENSSEGDLIEINGKIYEAVRIQGVMTLRDLSLLEDMEREIFILRRQIQRKIFNADLNFNAEINPNDTKLKNDFAKFIDSARNALTANNRLNSIRKILGNKNLMIGIVGLTSSGKSSFMNALLGERLIPEQTRATTNIPILCENGETRSANIFYQDGRVEKISGNKLNSELINNLSSESSNPGNKFGIARLEIFIPGALIPEGFSFMDTPGFDALTGNGNMVLRNILPELDYIIYVAPVRFGLKAQDHDLIKNFGRELLFVLSQIDLEKDDYEAGKIIKTRNEKILNAVSNVRNYYSHEIIPVSSKLALENFYSRNSAKWLESNFNMVINYLMPLQNNVFHNALIFRMKRAVKILDGLLKGRLIGNSRWQVQEASDGIKKLLAGTGNINLPHVTAENITSNYNSGKKENENLISSLIISMREREFKNKFFGLNAFKFNKKILLLGVNKSESLKLFSRLCHDSRLEELPEGNVSEREFLYSGNLMPIPAIKLPAYNNDILIAPPDKYLKDPTELFKSRVPVISIDLTRVDSGLSDLARSPYFGLLKNFKCVMSCGDGGLFDSRPEDLISQVPDRIKEFTNLNNLIMPDMFIYENYRIIMAQSF